MTDKASIQEAWEFLVTSAESMRTREMAAAAQASPVLSGLYPFASVNRLRFSRTDEYPFDLDLPYLVAVEDGSYEAQSEEGQPLGSGTAAGMVTILEAAVSGRL